MKTCNLMCFTKGEKRQKQLIQKVKRFFLKRDKFGENSS